MNEKSKLEELSIIRFWVIFVSTILACFFLYCNFVNPYLVVWQQGKVGEAELARADSNRQIATLEAMAIKESSKALAEAEIIRARGVAEANKIIGDSLSDGEGYLRYLWIQSLNHSESTVVYVPTEANLPILESQRLKGN